MKKCYYAHSVLIYGTHQEQRDVATLKDLGFEVINPNSPEYKKFTLAAFYDLVRQCDLLAFRSLPGGVISHHVAQEIQIAQGDDMLIIELPSLAMRKVLTAEESVQYRMEMGQQR